jgi:CRISPR-associated endonuclease Csn1
MPVSSPIYQLFRIWQQVNNIRLIDKYAKEQELAASERIAVVEHLLAHPELKADNLLKEIGRKGEPWRTTCAPTCRATRPWPSCGPC